MNATRSGDYRLPGPIYLLMGNLALRLAPLVPRWICQRFIASRPAFYQTYSTDSTNHGQGASDKKWDAMQMPADLRGRSVLDIGCSEGFFAQQCARQGAEPVLGVDSSLGRLLTAKFRSITEGLEVDYRIGVFPSIEITGVYDYVICLSLLHHSLRKKDLWKVLTEEEYAEDLVVLRSHMARLRALTATGGACVVEMPYEYDDPAAERQVVDFERFASELLSAGFSTVRCLGTWQYNPEHKSFKDRIIYVANG